MSTLGSISCRELERALKKLGFSFERQTGSHRAYIKSDIARPIIVPYHHPGQIYYSTNREIVWCVKRRVDTVGAIIIKRIGGAGSSVTPRSAWRAASDGDIRVGSAGGSGRPRGARRASGSKPVPAQVCVP